MTTGGNRGIWIALAVALHFLPLWHDGWQWLPPPPADWQVPSPRPSPLPPGEAAFHDEIIGPSTLLPAVHVASICELGDGRLAAVWYGGSREGAPDVAIYFCTRTPGLNGEWSAARPIVTRESSARELRRYVKKVGNAVVFSDGQGTVWLLYVSVGVGGWSGSSLNVKRSFDAGESWTPSQRLTLSPFFNVSELVKNAPVALADGGWAVPIYHELFGKFPEILWLKESRGKLTATKTRVFGGRTAFQPALLPLDAKNALLPCRACGPVRSIQVSRTSDGGSWWTPPEPASLPNPNSGLGALRLADGRLLLAFNDSTADRHNLRLATSSDEGVTWTRVATLEDEADAEFSYPFLLQTRDGNIHVVYTWKRRAIKHAWFSLGWLDDQRRKEVE